MSALGGFVNWVSNELNEYPDAHIPSWIVRLMAASSWWRLRTEAAWVISEQVRPSRRMLDQELVLLRDRDMRVRRWPALGLSAHAGEYSRPELEAGLPFVREIPVDLWDDPTEGQEWKSMTMTFIESALREHK